MIYETVPEAEKRPHPAKFSGEIISVINRMLGGAASVLDPFAGTGRIHRLRELGDYYTVGIEIEKEWANHHPYTEHGDMFEVLKSWPKGIFDAVATSPCYGNRMADTYLDHTRRHTYTSYLDRRPTEGSSAVLQWGNEYKLFHSRAWEVCDRVVRNSGQFILNCKDHIRKGEVQRVTDWHVQALGDLGWKPVRKEHITTRSNRHGQNGGSRLDGEWVIEFTKTL